MRIEVSRRNIHPHPDNPRKVIGDVTELADSIRSFGILQNLTVIPVDFEELTPEEKAECYEDKQQYRVLCGHRRLAAAKEAHLPLIPVEVLNNIDKKTQIAMMMSENMQRSDLTVQEEAQGFQMMLELGSTIEEIVKQTGFSETKVRHRVKMNELDQEVLSKKMEKNISINDLIELEKVKDIDKRNECLEAIGTHNFNWKINEAIKEQNKDRIRTYITEALPEATDKHVPSWKQEDREMIRFDAEEDALKEFVEKYKELSATDERDLIVTIEWNGIYLGFEKKEEEPEKPVEDPEKEKREAERVERVSKLEDVFDSMVNSWDEFISNCTDAKAKKNIDSILFFLVKDGLLVDRYHRLDVDEAISLQLKKPEVSTDTIVLNAVEHDLYRTTLICTYLELKPGNYDKPFNSFSGEYRGDSPSIDKLKELYQFLDRLGYEASDEELEMINGESDLFYRKEEE